MRVVDANVLLYAVNTDAERHEPSRRWLDHALSGADTVGFTWLAQTAFLRLATKVGLFPRPLSAAEGLDVVRAWLDAPGARLVAPSSQHLDVLSRLLTDTGSGGNLVTDAHLAAIAIEHRAELVSYDTDFTRFAGLRCRRPDELVGG